MSTQWITACSTIAMVLAGLADAQTRRFDFALLQGAGTPVCDAYVARLNQSEFTSYPYCDRPEDDRIAGFERLNRVPLSSEEIVRLYDTAYSFVHTGDPENIEKGRESRRRLGQTVTASYGPQAARENAERVRIGNVPFFYRFDPKVDIDNDGAVDDVIVWKDTSICGAISYRTSLPVPSPTFLIILDSAGNVDAAKTLALFAHPRGRFLVSSRGTEVAGTYRPIGRSMGVLQFGGATYFDTFYSQSDLRNERVDADPDINNVLAVLRHSNAETELVCEIHYRGPYDDLGNEK